MASDLPASPRPTMAAGFIPMSIPNCPVPRRLRPFTPLAATCSPTLIFGHQPFGMMPLDMAANLPASPRPTLAAGVTPMSMPKCPDPRRLRPFTPVAAKCCPPLTFGHQPFGMTTLLQHDASELSCSNMFHEHSQIHENPLLESSAAASSAADGAMQLRQWRENKRRGLTEAVAANCPVDFGAESTIQLRKATSAMKAMNWRETECSSGPDGCKACRCRAIHEIDEGNGHSGGGHEGQEGHEGEAGKS